MAPTTVHQLQKTPSPRRAPQTGATTLIVVMVLFFVAALAAAYASRNLIFEQRTSANQYRATQAFEAAEAGLDWALAMLNSGRIDASCQATADATADSFRQRYLNINPATGSISERNFRTWSACSLQAGAWTCSCPAAGASLATLPAGDLAFAVRFEKTTTARADVVKIEVQGCNALNAACTPDPTPLNPGNCNATLCSLLTKSLPLKAKPLAAVTAKTAATGAGLAVTNADVAAGGITVNSGGTVSADYSLTSTAGTPGAQSARGGDSQLADLPPDADDCLHCLFTQFMGISKNDYKRQPAVVTLDCPSATPCTAANLVSEIAKRRSNVFWLSGAGGLTITSPTDVLGTQSDPILIVAEGPVRFESSATASPTSKARLFGFIYASSLIIDGGRVDGAVVSSGDVAGAGTGEVFYDAAVLTRLQRQQGSIVRVPGGWRDFP